MPLNILFIIDPLATLVPHHDTSLAVMEEAERRKHHVWIAEVKDLRMGPQKAFGDLKRVMFKKNSWQVAESKSAPLESMDVIFMRKDPPYNIDYIMACSILAFVDKRKTFIVNDPDILRTMSEKVGIFHFPEYIPETIVTKSHEQLKTFLKNHKTIVVKPLDLNSGQEVLVVNEHDRNRDAIFEIMTAKEARFITAQRYLAEVRKGDKRIIVLDGKVLGVLNRIPQEHDHRANLHAGAVATFGSLNKKERAMCEDIAQRLKKMGVWFAGFDLIGGYLTEINHTSPTGIVEIHALTGVQLERDIIDFFESAVEARKRSGTNGVA